MKSGRSSGGVRKIGIHHEHYIRLHNIAGVIKSPDICSAEPLFFARMEEYVFILLLEFFNLIGGSIRAVIIHHQDIHVMIFYIFKYFLQARY